MGTASRILWLIPRKGLKRIHWVVRINPEDTLGHICWRLYRLPSGATNGITTAGSMNRHLEFLNWGKRRGMRFSRTLSVLTAVGVLTAISGVAYNVERSLSGHGYNPNGFVVNVVNDTPSVVSIEQCAGSGRSCRIAPYSAIETVKPGHSIATAQTWDYREPLQIMRPSGTIIGCLPFRYVRTPNHLSVVVTSMVPCGHSLGAAAVHGKDWPDPRN